VKLPLKILNTSVYRGVPEHYTLAAPMVTEWLRGLWYRDEVLRRLGTELLGEVASVTVRHPQLSHAPGIYQWTETLGCIWRDPVDPRLQPGETVWPLAAVLHPTLVEAMIARSGADVRDWIGHLLSALLRPLFQGPGRRHQRLHRAGRCPRHRTRLARPRPPAQALAHPPPVPGRRTPARRTQPTVRPARPRRPAAQRRVLGHDPRREIEPYAKTFPEYDDRLAATDLLGETFARYPLNGYRLTLGYTDLDTRPPIPTTGRIPNPLHTAKPIKPRTSW
jgi:siderophore synthetase component